MLSPTKIAMGLLLMLLVGAAEAQESGWYQRARSTPPTPKYFISTPPGSEFYPQYKAPGPVSAVPAFQWGYFGARSKSSAFNHRGYYGDETTTVFPRGY